MKRILVRLGLLPEGKLNRKEIITYVKKKGWRWLAVVVIFYAIRDAVLYILLPYLVLRGILFGW